MRAMLLLLVLAGPALGDAKTAAVHNRQAKAYFDAKQYDSAIDEFKKSYAQDKQPLTLFKIASAYFAKADYQNAIDFYGQYLQAQPDGRYAAEALQFTTVAKQKLDEEKAKQAAADEAAKKAAAEKAAVEEAEKKRVAAASHLENAKAFARANAWTSAGDEYRAATEADGDPAHLLDAADAYRKQPDHAKAADAYRAYIEKVPLGAKTDEARAKLAESTRAIEDEAEKKRVADAAAATKRDEPEPKQVLPPIARGWSSFGPRISIGLSQPDSNPLLMNSSDGLVAKPSLDVGFFGRYQLTTRIALRPEINGIFRMVAYDGRNATTVVTDAVTFKRAGLQVAAPIYFSVKDADGFRFGVGPFLAAMPYFSADLRTNEGISGNYESSLIDYGLIAAIELDFGLVSVEARFSKSFGETASDFDSTMYTAVAGVAIGFEPARAARAP